MDSDTAGGARPVDMVADVEGDAARGVLDGVCVRNEWGGSECFGGGVDTGGAGGDSVPPGLMGSLPP